MVFESIALDVRAHYPVFWRWAELIPGGLSFTIILELAFALFVAPVLLDAGYDASQRDLMDNWIPLTGLVFFRSP